MEQINIFGGVDHFDENGEILTSLDGINKHLIMTKTVINLSRIYTSKFGVLRYCNQTIRTFGEDAVEVKFEFNNEVLKPEDFGLMIQEMKEYLIESNIHHEFTNNNLLLMLTI